jgi:hypothetical protein
VIRPPTFGIAGARRSRISLLGRKTIQNLLAGGATLAFWIEGGDENPLPWNLDRSGPIDPALLAVPSVPAPVDFLLQLDTRPLEPTLARLPRMGVWRFSPASHHPLAFWETYDALSTVEVRLDRLTLDHTLRIPLGRRWIQVVRHSYRETLDRLVAEMSEMPLYAWRCRLDPMPDPVGFPPAIRTDPSEIDLASLRMKLAFRKLARQVHGLLFTESWRVGIVDAPISRFLDPECRLAPTWLPERDRAHFLADPFLAGVENGWLLVAEEFDYSTNTGSIVEEFSPDGSFTGRMRPSVRENCHMSYPYLLTHQGQLFCIPETHENNQAAAWQRDPDSGCWTDRRPLLTGLDCIDPTPVHFEGRWWLFCTRRADGADSKLLLFYADDLFGPWTPHPCNPVKVDVRSSRPAGTPFLFRGRLYRPAQDCSRHYGFRLLLHRIRRMTPEAFEEETVRVIEGDRWGCNGIHTIAGCRGKTVLDGRYERFTPWRTPRLLAQKLRTGFRRLLGSPSSAPVQSFDHSHKKE